MKLDSTIIGALIIGASILLSTMYYSNNTDFMHCFDVEYKLKKGDPTNTRSDLGKKAQAIRVCSAYLRSS